MGLISFIKDKLMARRKLMLDMSEMEKIELWKKDVLIKFEELYNDKNLSDEQKYEEFGLILENIKKYLNANNLNNENISDDKIIEQIQSIFPHNTAINELCNFYVETAKELDLCNFLNEWALGIYKFDEKVGDLKEKLDNIFSIQKNDFRDKIKVLTIGEKYKKTIEIINKFTRNEESMRMYRNIVKNFYINEIDTLMSNSKTVKEVVSLYKILENEIFDNDVSSIQSLMEKGEMYNKIRVIKRLEESGIDLSNKSIELIPSLIINTKELNEEILEEKNRMIAENKMYKEITIDDLIYIRTTNVLPRDGVVETIGNYSAYEECGNPLEESIKSIDEKCNVKDFMLIGPRYRETIHFCANAVVGDHANGKFGGRDYFILEKASEHRDDKSQKSSMVSDIIFQGDIKLSKSAKIFMSIDKYIELYKDSKSRKQLENLDILIYEGNPEMAIHKYLNDNNYVWGNVSSYSYVKGLGKEYRYLENLEKKLRNQEIEGLRNVEYISDEGLDTYASSKYEDTKYMYEVYIKYLNFIINKNPELDIGIDAKTLTDKLMSSSSEMRGLDICTNIVTKIGIEKLKKYTQEFNKLQEKECKINRAKKNQELLEKNMITKEEYDLRQAELYGKEIEMEEDKVI